MLRFLGINDLSSAYLDAAHPAATVSIASNEFGRSAPQLMAVTDSIRNRVLGPPWHESFDFVDQAPYWQSDIEIQINTEVRSQSSADVLGLGRHGIQK
jgi:hypothetical protein